LASKVALATERRLRKTVHAVHAALFCVRDVQCLLRAGDTDVTQATLLLEAVRVCNGSLVWKQSIFHAAKEY
jgi:hypothetical protein